MKTEKQVWNARLSATPCDLEMRDAMLNRAKQEGKTLAQLQREAFAFFLSKNVTQCDNKHVLCAGE